MDVDKYLSEVHSKLELLEELAEITAKSNPDAAEKIKKLIAEAKLSIAEFHQEVLRAAQVQQKDP